MKKTILVMTFLFCSSPGVSDEIVTDPSGNTLEAQQPMPRNLLSYEFYGYGIGFERAVNPHLGLRALFHFINWGAPSENQKGDIWDKGLDLVALGYLFGKAPKGLFVGLHGTVYQREYLNLRASSIHYGPVLGYNSNPFKRAILGLRLDFDYENVLSDEGSLDLGDFSVKRDLIWEKKRESGVPWIHPSLSLGWMF